VSVIRCLISSWSTTRAMSAAASLLLVPTGVLSLSPCLSVCLSADLDLSSEFFHRLIAQSLCEPITVIEISTGSPYLILRLSSVILRASMKAYIEALILHMWLVLEEQRIAILVEKRCLQKDPSQYMLSISMCVTDVNESVCWTKIGLFAHQCYCC